jgi:transposase
LAKSAREIMEILEAFDLTRCAWSAAQLVGCDPKTVAAYVAVRDAGADPLARPRRPRGIDPFLAKLEELVDRSAGKIRADVAHDRLVAMGFAGSDRTTRRTVAELKATWRAGHGRVYRPWIPEPGMWLQFDWGDGPRIAQRRTSLFCAWLAWSRYRVVIPTWDQTLPTLVACLDQTLRRLGGTPTYLLSDNAKSVTVEHVAGIPVRHPEMVAVGRHYGCKVETCVAYDPESKGGAEATVKLAKADLVPTSANLRGDYPSFAELVWACERFLEQVNQREHRETRQVPVVRLATERAPAHPAHRATHPGAGRGPAGEEGPDHQLGWCAVFNSAGLARPDPLVPHPGRGAGHRRPRSPWPGGAVPPPAVHARHPRIADEHYPHHPGGRHVHAPKPRPRTPEEVAFLQLGEGAHRWLIEAGAAGTARVRAKMAQAVELAAPSAPSGSTRRWAWPPSRAASPRTTSPRSWITWPLPGSRAMWSGLMRPTRCSPVPTRGGGWASEHTARPAPARRTGSRPAPHAPAVSA